MANTTNLNLVKPAGTDHALISDINGNMDIIDAFAGEITAAIENLNISAISSSTTIASLCNSCPAGEHRYYFIADSATLTDFPTTTRTYRVLLEIHKIDGTNNQADIRIMGKPGSNVPSEHIGVYENGTLYWATTTLNIKSGSVSFAASDFSTVSLGTFTYRAAKSPISGVTKILSATAVAPGSSWVLLPQLSSSENGIVLLANGAGAIKVNYLYV